VDFEDVVEGVCCPVSGGWLAQDQVEAVGGGGEGVVDLQEADGSRAQVGVGAAADAEDLVEEVAVVAGATDVDDGVRWLCRSWFALEADYASFTRAPA
jgi:hypothetical protein